MDYLFRYFDSQLEDALSYSGAVLIKGPKFCGKTTSALQVSKSDIRINTLATAKLIEADPVLALRGEVPHLIDEWQIVPDIYNCIKNDIDLNYVPGKYILTGSATPADKSQILHSGAGRITPLLMRPMSLYESEDSKGGVSLSNLFNNKIKSKVDGKINLDKICQFICRGGWPLTCKMDYKKALNIIKSYYKNLFTFSESTDVIFRNKNTSTLYAILKSYARNISTEASNKILLNDVKEITQTTLSYNTLTDYLEALRDLYIIEEMPAWSPQIKSKTTIRSKVTRHFIDPSIGAMALGLNPNLLMQDPTSLGLFFEDLAVRDLRIYTDNLGGEVKHYRDNTGLECDAVIILDDGRWAIAEIKLGGHTSIEQGAETLLRLKNKIKQLSNMCPPSFELILTAGGASYQRKDGIYVVPITNLKA